MHKLIQRFVFSLVVCSATSTCLCNDWPQFRGHNSSGVADTGPLPVTFGPGKHELWSLPLDSGHSSPCIVGDAIFLTTYQQQHQRLEVICIDRDHGTVRWRREVPVDEIETGHPSFNPASSSPVSDGERVVAYFGSYGLICFDLKGDLVWDMRLPLTKSYAGNATSPTMLGDRVFLYRGNHVDHFLLAVDKRTGEQLWRVDQEEPFATELACTACPIAIGEKLIVHTARSLQAYDIGTGNRIWHTKCATTATSTPVIAGDDVIVAAWNKMGEPALRPAFPRFSELVAKHDKDGDATISSDEFPRLMIFHRPDGAEAPQNGASIRFSSADVNHDGEISQFEWTQRLRLLEAFRAQYQTHGVLAVPMDCHGLVDSKRVRTLEKQGVPEVPSPLFYQGHVYFVKNGGVLTCVNLKTGKRVARIRTRGKGTHYASPVIGDGKLFSIAGDGQISVVSLGKNPQLLEVNDMQDSTYATPAIVDGRIYVRTHTRLYAFGFR